MLAVAFASLIAPSCGGGGSGGSSEPDPEPNQPPIVLLPSGLAGTSPVVSYVLPLADSAQLRFTAVDPEGLALQWQVFVPGSQAAQAGLGFVTPTVGPLLVLDLSPVAAPYLTTLNLLVEDPAGGAAAIELTVVRSGPPTLESVDPDTGFSARPRTVTLRGSGFALGSFATTQASFGGVPAQSTTVVDDATLTCRTPSALLSGSVSVGVSNQFGSDLLGPDAFRFFAFPPQFAATDTQLDLGAAPVASQGLSHEGGLSHVVFAAGGQAFGRRSQDGGRTFDPASLLSATEVASEPVIAQGEGFLVAAWIGDGQQVLCRRSTDGGQSFASTVVVDGGLLPASGLQLATRGEAVALAWIAGQRVRYSASADGGQSFQPAQQLDAGVTAQSELRLVGAGDAFVLACLDDVPSSAERGVYVSRSPLGLPFTAPRRLSNPLQASGELQMAADGAAVHVVWSSIEGISYNGSADAGVTFRTPETLVRGAEAPVPGRPQVAASGAAVHVVYETADQAIWLARSTDLGASFPSRRQLDAGSLQATGPALACDGEYVVACWQQGDPQLSQSRVTYVLSTDGGSSFTVPTGFGDAVDNPSALQVRLDSARIFMAWLESRTGQSAAFCNANAP